MVAVGAGQFWGQAVEVADNPYLNPYASWGEEVSSTYEGRHIVVQEVVLVHADLYGDGLVRKGQPIAFWEGVGIALKTASATSDNIPIDTEGICRVSVVSGIDDIYVGQSLYITNAGVVTDDPTGAMAVFGYALQTVNSGETSVVAVKVHWMSLNWIWLFWYFLQP